MWTLSLIERVAAYNGNQTILTDVLCPLLDKSLQFFQHLQVGGNSTMPEIHLPPTMSPEYPHTVEADANYAIALYRWGLQTAISLADRFPDEENCGGSPSSDSIGYQHYLNWTSTLKLLTWFPIDNVTNTLEIYRGVPYGVPHRHYSHLFSIWPLHLLDLTNETQSTTARDSINLWLATPEEDSMFYRPAASAMNVLLRNNAAAFDNVTYLLNRRIDWSTWYREGQEGAAPRYRTLPPGP